MIGRAGRTKEIGEEGIPIVRMARGGRGVFLGVEIEPGGMRAT
jgi:hypothetical protein